MRILIVSGSRWGATQGNQRYQALAENFKKINPEIEVKFYSYVDGTTPPPYRWTGDHVDVIIVGYPELGNRLLQNFEGRILAPIIYDICDYWRGNELIAGTDLVEADEIVAQRSLLFVTVNWQLACQYVQYKKPIYVIGNGLREEAMTPPSVISDDKVHIYYWGSHFTGQTWTDTVALMELPKRFPQCQFYYFLATDMLTEMLFPEMPENLHVETSPLGIEFDRIKSFIRYPAIGIVPFKPLNTAAFFADPIKVYEYWALGMYVVGVNIWSGLGERATIIYRQGEVLDELSAGIEDLLRRRNLEPQFPSEEEKRMLSWEARAKQYFTILTKLSPSPQAIG
jgi:hypothetical protein